MREAQAAASALGVEAVILEIRRAEDIAAAFETSKGRVDALYVASDPLLTAIRRERRAREHAHATCRRLRLKLRGRRVLPEENWKIGQT